MRLHLVIAALLTACAAPAREAPAPEAPSPPPPPPPAASSSAPLPPPPPAGTGLGAAALPPPPATPPTPSAAPIKSTRSLPIDLGTARANVVAQLGKTTRTGADFDTFAVGLVIDYANDLVIKVAATSVVDGNTYPGKVLGVAIGDTFDSAVGVWGAPASRGPGLGYDKLHWDIGYKVDVELWTATHDETAFGHVLANTIKRIEVSR